MQYKNITCIINPSSGKDTPILGAINAAVQKSDSEWKLHITQKKGDIARYVKKGIERNTDLFIVYGGDGSIMEAARELITHPVPLLILPGGTANVISKELKIPQEPKEVFNLLLKDALQLQSVDMGVVDSIPFLLRVNYGFFADMVRETDPSAKQNYGQLAYGLTAASQLPKLTPQHYTIKLDSKTVETEAVGVMVTNVGSVGVGTLTLNQNITSTDGVLDIIVMKSVDLGSIFNLAASTLTQANLEGSVKHYQSSQVTITSKQPQRVVCDDEERTLTDGHFKVRPAALHVLVPIK